MVASTPKPKRAKPKSTTKPKPKTKPKSKVARPRGAAARPQRPPAGSFTDGRFSGPHGGLDYKLYTPVGSPRRRLPLVVMLHGCNQSAADFAAGSGMNAVADELGFLVLYPQQSTSSNLGRCWNWHRAGDQERGSGEPEAIAALTRHVIALCKANPDRVYIAGLSAGGAAAAITAAAYPDLYVAVGVHSGVARGDIRTLRGAMAAVRSGLARAAPAKPLDRFPPSSSTATRTGSCTPATRMAFCNISRDRARRRWSVGPSRAKRLAVAPSPARSTAMASGMCAWRIGGCTAADTAGPAGGLSGPTPTQAARTHRAR
nr:PHB depolymerase family esterase [Caulobacter hibisci]